MERNENLTKIVASLLGTLAFTNEGKKLSNMMIIEDQGATVAFYKDSSTFRIPTQGDGLDVIYAIVKGLRERRDAEKNRD